MKKDIKMLKKELIHAHNRQMESLASQEHNLKKATNRTTIFPLFYVRDFVCVEGGINLDMETGRFSFSTDYNNHTVDDLENGSNAFKALMHFLSKLDVKGKTYGATTYYKSEYDAYEGTREHYGGWMPDWKRKALKK